MAFYDGKSDNVVNGDANQFDVVPGVRDDSSGKKIYTVGKYKAKFKNYMLKWWAFYKAIAQRPDPRLSDGDSEISEKGALVLSSLKRITHTPPQPKDMDDAVYSSGKSGCAKGNLFAVGYKYWFHEAVQFNFTEGKTQDDGKVTIPAISSMGHRWNGLWKRATSAGFGYNYFNGYTAVVFRVVGNSASDGGFQGFSAFPHGCYPVQAELKVNNQRSSSGLFDKRYPRGAKDDVGRTSAGATGYHCIWTIQQISGYTISSGKSVRVTIRDTDEKGPILDEIVCDVNSQINNSNGSFLRIKKSSYSGGWAFTVKPKHGIISGAFKEVLNTNKKKVFHITLSGDGITPKTGTSNLSYRIIYYDIDV